MHSRNENDDMPCDLCKQLVTHLKEIMVANTTESEFKQVLEGICKQAKSPFNKECLDFVNNYYAEIYNDVTKALDPSLACEMIGICPSKNDQVTVISITKKVGESKNCDGCRLAD